MRWSSLSKLHTAIGNHPAGYAGNYSSSDIPISKHNEELIVSSGNRLSRIGISFCGNGIESGGKEFVEMIFMMMMVYLTFISRYSRIYELVQQQSKTHRALIMISSEMKRKISILPRKAFVRVKTMRHCFLQYHPHKFRPCNWLALPECFSEHV